MLTLGYVGGSLVESLPFAYWKTYTLGIQLVSTGGFALFWVNASPSLMSTTRPHNRPKIYGALHAAGNFGALFGMLAGGFLPTALARFLSLSLDTTHPYRLALLGCTLFAVPALLAIARFEGEQQSRTGSQTGERKRLSTGAHGSVDILCALESGSAGGLLLLLQRIHGCEAATQPKCHRCSGRFGATECGPNAFHCATPEPPHAEVKSAGHGHSGYRSDAGSSDLY